MDGGEQNDRVCIWLFVTGRVEETNRQANQTERGCVEQKNVCVFPGSRIGWRNARESEKTRRMRQNRHKKGDQTPGQQAKTMHFTVLQRVQ